MKFMRRIGPHPHDRPQGGGSTGQSSCPDIWELDSGDFAIIGFDGHNDLIGNLPHDANCHSDERIIIIPRETLILAKPQIPEY
ncbi:hypothetical protein SAMN05421505_106123 [Sinosporangium album]|uniref:Uncharacterized protein n=1 Tax=Sinosporangium album TaxID=504805 RepID=A0A1G7W1K7_9ACTN|nr:hypothetical protein [Sinosporangium album]SDG65020.1 hypothetical protein SAMN05421505_106123 [Sinosporangium album]